MLTTQNIARALEFIRKMDPKNTHRSTALDAVAAEYNRIIGEVEILNEKIMELIDENYDFLCDELLNGDELETILLLSFDSDHMSIQNRIFRSHGMYFFSGTDLDDLGPYETAEGAFYEAEVFLSERDEPFAEIYISQKCPRELFISTLNAIQKCEQITFKGPSFEIYLDG